MEEIKNKELSEKIQYIIENFEFLIKGFNLKILWWWRIMGLIGLALLIIIGYVFCSTSSQLVVLGFIGLFLLCGWMIVNYHIQRETIKGSSVMLEYGELTDLKLYIADMFLTDAIEIKARGTYSRDRLLEIKTLCELLRTQEGIKKATSILKALDLNLNDIQWMEGSKTGIRIVEEDGKKNNNNLTSAKKAKNDEFYTQYADIQVEVNAYLDFNPDLFRNKVVLCPCDDPEWSNFTKFFAQNFKRFGLKKFISTSYSKIPGQLGKIFWIDRDVNGDGKVDINDLQWDWLLGNGDFRSLEVTKIRDQVDFIITNPPFSLFREFMDWIWKGPGLQFLVIGNMNAITYKEIFPKIKDNKMWIGNGFNMSLVYKTPYTNNSESNKKVVKKKGYNPDEGYVIVPAICWFTNIDHGRRHQPLQLMTVAENLRLSKHDAIKGKTFEEAYPKYDNYDAIEVSYTDAIPKDYDGVMGVPISFLDKYCPDQFELLDTTERWSTLRKKKYSADEYSEANDMNATWVIMTSNGYMKGYKRLLIRKK